VTRRDRFNGVRFRLTLCVAWSVGLSATLTAQTLYPRKDGTLVDGGTHGPFDGTADYADWYFNESTFEGSITLDTGLEHRVVWEYDLSTITLEPPVAADLAFTIRGASIYPFPDVPVHVYAYPADLQETLEDFLQGPAALMGSVTIAPFQAPTRYVLDVSTVVSAAISSGDNMVAFRFQIDPDSPYTANQAFMDAVDSDPTTKPPLTISPAPVAGDLDDDGDADLDDFASFFDCLLDLGSCPSGQADLADFDGDGDVDLHDYADFQSVFTGNSG
jgi:hypothetical protein